MHLVLLLSEKFGIFLELSANRSIEFLKFLLKLIPAFFRQVLVCNSMLKLDYRNFIGFLRYALIKASNHFFHLLVLCGEIILTFSAKSDKWFNFSFMFCQFLIAGELRETLINSFNVIFGNQTCDGLLLLFFQFCNVLVGCIFHFQEIVLQHTLRRFKYFELRLLVMCQFFSHIIRRLKFFTCRCHIALNFENLIFQPSAPMRCSIE